MSGFASVVVAIVAIVVAACSVTITAIGLRRKTDADDTANLRRQLEELKGGQIEQDRKLRICEEARAEFQIQNFQLLLKLTNLEQGQKP